MYNLSFNMEDDSDYINHFLSNIDENGLYVGCIYQFERIEDGRKYIGKTCCEKKRYYQHLNPTKKSVHEYTYFDQAIHHCGKKAFKYTRLRICRGRTQEELNWQLGVEEHYIIKDNPECLRVNGGYNSQIPGLPKTPKNLF